jgi:hydrogenase maturation protease
MPAGKFLVGCFPASEFFVNTDAPVKIEAELLVIGYGNSLRRDDGVGPRVAEAVEELHLPGVRTLVCQLLSPEYADPIARARRVIFVDAAVDRLDGVHFRKLEPGETSQLMAHAADPRTMLALARDVFGHAPEAWWLTIPAIHLGFGTDYSPEAEAGFHTAVAEIRRLAANFCAATAN